MSEMAQRMAAKPKRKVKSKEFVDSDEEDCGGSSKPKPKRPKVKPVSSATTEEEDMIQLSPKRFVVVRSFKGKVLVDIREFYEDDSGVSRPGRKGIALSKEQWERLKDASSEIDAKIDSLTG